MATHLEAFRKYQREQAWTWEHMALTRARPVAGAQSLLAEVEADIAEILALPCDPRKIAEDACEMRDLIATEKPPRDEWDVKLVPGGLIDLEFIAQVATLIGALEGEERSTSTVAALARLSPNFCDAQTRDELVEAHNLFFRAHPAAAGLPDRAVRARRRAGRAVGPFAARDGSARNGRPARPCDRDVGAGQGALRQIAQARFETLNIGQI